MHVKTDVKLKTVKVDFEHPELPLSLRGARILRRMLDKAIKKIEESEEGNGIRREAT